MESINADYSQFQDMLKESGPYAWLIAVGVALFVSFVLKIAANIVAKRGMKWALRTRSFWDDAFFACLEKTGSIFIFAWVFYPLLLILPYAKPFTNVGRGLLIVISCFQVITWGICTISVWKREFIDRHVDSQSSLAAIGLLSAALKGFVIIGAVLMALSNLGVDVGALVAGLGVGGIAVALAAQNVLGDLLASLSIVLDKPFVIGDSIQVGTQSGTVQSIGVKTTRVRALSGEELIFANKDLLESRVQNFKRMRERRVARTIGVTYATPREKLEQIPAWIKGLIERDNKLRFDRAHLSNFGNSSIDFEVVFYVKEPDYALYMDRQQVFFLDLFSKFEQEKIEFAFPSQTVYLQGTKSTAVEVGLLPERENGNAQNRQQS